MTRNILPKSDETMRMKPKNSEPTVQIELSKTNSSSINKITNRAFVNRQLLAKTTSLSTKSTMSSEEDEEPKSRLESLSINATETSPADSTCVLISEMPSSTIDLGSTPPFSRTRLSQWHSNEEIYSILTQCSHLLALSGAARLLNEWLSAEECIVMRRPVNGSVFLFDRRRVKNFKKDGFSWKRRKTGGANSVREDRMYLKINGVDKIYGCYSHSSIISTFHRRCYWLLDKPDLVLVHYLHTPNTETGECVINLNAAVCQSQTSDVDQSQMNKDDAIQEIKSMLWPYYLNEQFIQENSKLCHDLQKNVKTSVDDLLSALVGNLFNQTGPVRIVLNSLSTSSNSTEPSRIETGDQATVHDKNPQISSDKQVFLSISSCSANGGEKLMLIGNWADTKNYSINLNGIEIRLTQLNKHVLECHLPKFEWIFTSPDASNKFLPFHSSFNSDQEFVYKTYVYLYENGNLYCPPMPFEIKYNLVSQNQIISSRGENKNEPPENQLNYKNQLFLLERSLILLKIYGLSQFEYGYFHSSKLLANQSRHFSFEKRICQMIDGLREHFNGRSTNRLDLNLSPESFSRIEMNLNNEHEGKTLLHICAESALNEFFECLRLLKDTINTLNESAEMSIIKNEMKLFKLDHHGYTPLMLACRNGSTQIALELFIWHKSEFETDNNRSLATSSSNSHQPASFTSSSWYFHMINSIGEANKRGHRELASKLDTLLREYQTEYEASRHLKQFKGFDEEPNASSKTYLESIESIKKQIMIPPTATENTIDLNLPSPSLMIDENFRLIENLEDLSCLLADESTELDEDVNKPVIEHAKQLIHEEAHNLDLAMDESMPSQTEENQQMFSLGSNLAHTQTIKSPPPKQLDDDQDKKIKTLADNIIAAMPHKIKTNSYSSMRADSVGSNSNLTQQLNDGCGSPFRPISGLRRETISFDDNYDPGISLSSCYSSSTRSSISPSSSLSYQFNSHEPYGVASRSRFVDDSQQFSPGQEDSTCSSTFHIDSPPSTAEFCQYFRAGSSSSAYYRHAIETGFAQLTLTDDEQRELYEAALVIQNAYRRYIQRKKKKIRLDDESVKERNNIDSQLVQASVRLFNLQRQNSSSLLKDKRVEEFSIPQPPQQSQELPNAVKFGTRKSAMRQDDVNLSDDDENNSINGEDQRQYQAACIIQKYYRRYKQYENLQKYTEAAVKSQPRYPAYKPQTKPYQYKMMGCSSGKLKSHYQHNSIDETSIMNGCGSNGGMSVNGIECGDCDCANCRRLIGSDMQLNCMNRSYYNPAHRHHQCTGATITSPQKYQYSPMMMLGNQRQISRKLINVRHSSRYSPASPISPAPSASFINSTPSSGASQLNGSLQNFQNPLGSDLVGQNVDNIRRKISDNELPLVMGNNVISLNNNQQMSNNSNNLTMNELLAEDGFPVTANPNSNRSYEFERSDKQMHQSLSMVLQQPTYMSGVQEDKNDDKGSFFTLANESNDTHVRVDSNSNCFDESNFWTYLTKANMNLRNNLKARITKQQKTCHLNFQPTFSINISNIQNKGMPFIMCENHKDVLSTTKPGKLINSVIEIKNSAIKTRQTKNISNIDNRRAADIAFKHHVRTNLNDFNLNEIEDNELYEHVN